LSTRRVFVAALLLALAGCATTPPAAVKPPPPPDPATVMPALEQRLAVLIEEEREKNNPTAKPLAIDPELTGIARKRSADMAAKNYMAHAAPNGDTSGSLLTTEDAKFQGLLGENMAALHYVKQSGVDVDAFAKGFLDIWLKSPQHRDNLTFADYDRTGIGAAVNGDTVYVTALFALDLDTGAKSAPVPKSP
jgi:uncharacterized protein YkwD